MNSDDCNLGFRIVGNCTGERRLVDWPTAFAAYCQCDERAEVDREAYLSAFTFPDEFSEHLRATRSTKGYAGRCGAAWLWFDIDAEGELEHATAQARRLCAGIVERYGIDGDAMLVFFSGSKGFHVGLPMALMGAPPPSPMFHKVARHYACGLAERLGVTIDSGVYDKVRAFRAPNSWHPKTGLHKRRLTFDELMGLKVTALVRMASEPGAFDVPVLPGTKTQAVDDWAAAVRAVEQEAKALAERRVALRESNGADATLNRQTREFLVEGAIAGDRHRLLFSAAANLAEFGCPPALAHALLSEPGLDSGLSPTEVRRQIDCGLEKRGLKKQGG